MVKAADRTADTVRRKAVNAARNGAEPLLGKRRRLLKTYMGTRVGTAEQRRKFFTAIDLWITKICDECAIERQTEKLVAFLEFTDRIQKTPV